MDLDPSAWAQGAAAIKTAFEAFRSAIAMVRDLRATSKGSQEQERLLDEALAQASSAAKIAEAQVAKALGYELCKCKFPPIPMLTVGYLTRGPRDGQTVYECPECRFNTAGPYHFQRTGLGYR
jgi:hypothetical protein